MRTTSRIHLSVRLLLKRLAPGAAAAAAANAHVLDASVANNVDAFLVKTADCDANGNCASFVFRARDVMRPGGWAHAEITPILEDQSAWSVFTSFGPNRGLPGITITATLARRASAGDLDLKSYRETPADTMAPDRLVADVCAHATGVLSPASESQVLGPQLPAWDLAAMKIAPSACGAGVPRPRIAADATQMLNVLQDETGAIWGAGVHNLYRWDNDAWQVQPAPADEPWEVSISTDPNGGVDVVYDDTSARKKVALHHLGDQSAPIAVTAIPPDWGVETSAGFLVSLGGEGSPTGIARWTPGAPPQPVLTTLKLQVRTGKNDQPLGIGPLRATRDAEGNTWIWSTNLLGVLVTRGNDISYLTDFPGLPSSPEAPSFSLLSPWDATHIAAIVSGNLYQIDIRTRNSQPIPLPTSSEAVVNAFVAGGRQYAVTHSVRYDPNVLVVNQPQTLWRNDDGKWSRLLDHASRTLAVAECDCPPSRAWASAGGALWVAASPTGIWYVPAQGPAQLLDWSHGIPLRGGVNEILPLNAGRLFVKGADAATLDSASVLASQPPAPGFTLAPVSGAVAVDAAKHLWGLKPDALLQWDGTRWNTYSLPGLDPETIAVIATDSVGGIWLMPNCQATNARAAARIFSSITGQWQTVDNLETAVQAIYPKDHFVPPAGFESFFNPVSGPNGQIAYLDSCGRLHAFDGHLWRRWTVDQFPGASDLRPTSQPGFDSMGRLSLNTASVIAPTPATMNWRWDFTNWVHGDDMELPPLSFNPFALFALSPNGTRPEPGPPTPGCDSAWPESRVVDGAGHVWWTAGGNLYEGILGRCAIALKASDIQPFIDGRGVLSVLLDCCGNALLETDPVWGDLEAVLVRVPILQ